MDHQAAALLTDLVPARQRDRVAALAPALAADAAEWVGDVETLGPTLFDRLAVTIAAVAPDLPEPDLRLLMRHSTWLYLLDARLDETSAVAATLAAAVSATLRGAHPPETDPFLSPLAYLRDEFRRRDRHGAMLPALDRSLADSMAATARQQDRARLLAAGTGTAPTAEDYLTDAARHINYRPFALALLLVVTAEPTADLLDGLDDALEAASRAVRLANDLRTLPKDRAERGLNVLLLSSADGTPTTTGSVTDDIRRLLADHERALAGVPADAARALRAALRVSVGVYRVTDLRFDLDPTA